MKSYDEVIRWTDVGRPDEPVAIEVSYLGGYVDIEQEHIEKAARIGGNPQVLVREISDPQYEPIKNWEVVDLAPEGSHRM